MVISQAVTKFDLAQRRVNLLGLSWFLLLVVSALPIYWLGLESLAAAWITPEYSHGPIIPMISLYLFVRELRRRPPAPAGTPADRRPGILLVLFAMVFAIFGDIVHIPDLVTYALILWVGGVMLTGLGWDQGRHHFLPVFHLIFMLPLPQMIYWKLSVFLMGVSSQLGVDLLNWLNVPVFLEGNVIDLGVYKLQVAEACSGLRYLFPILSFSYLFAILYRGPFWHKIVLLLTAVPLTVLMNSFRIGVIGLLVDAYGIQQAEGFLHFFEGWVIFLACVGILFLLAMALQRLTPSPKTLSETIDLDFQGFGPQFSRIFGIGVSKGLVVAALLSTAVVSAFVLAPTTPLSTPPRDSFAFFPRDIGTWSGSTKKLAPDVAKVLRADDYIDIDYFSPISSQPVNFFVAYYRNQLGGAGIHSPQVCLPSGGWEVSAISQYGVDMTGTGYGKFNVNRAVIQNGMVRQLVYYWFEQRGKRMTNDYLVKASMIWDSLTRRRADGALVRFVTPIGSDETVAQADVRLQQVMRLALRPLPRFVPQ